MKLTKEKLIKMIEEKPRILECLDAIANKEAGSICTSVLESCLIDSYNKLFNKTPVDMSVLAGSGIDCVLHNSRNMSDIYPYRRLARIADGYYHCKAASWTYCKPRMNHWFSARNFDNVPGLVNKLKSAGFSVICTHFITRDIESFMIDGLQENRCWPWEKGQ